MASGSHLIANDIAAWRWVNSSLMCALTRCILLVAEVLLGACPYHRVQASHAEGLDRVEASDVC